MDNSSKPKRAIKKAANTRVVHEPDDVLREQASGFTDFLREYAVVGLAIGFILGQQANTVVKQFVASFIQPWLQLLFGASLDTQKFTIHQGATKIDVAWGAFVYILIEFVIVAIIVYVVFRLLKLEKLKQPRKEEDKKQ